MPKGRHKGGRRHFTNFEAVEEEKKKEEKARQWREQRGESNSEDEEEGGSDESEESSESSSSEEEEKEVKAKGVSNLIETANPNRVVQKTKKVSAISPDEGGAKPQLTRRQREEMEKQRAAARYRKMHAAGKTEEARADLARLALIKQQREEAARKREEEKKSKEAAAAAKRDQLAKVLNKKS